MDRQEHAGNGNGEYSPVPPVMTAVDTVGGVSSTIAARRIHTVNHSVAREGSMVAFRIQRVAQDSVTEQDRTGGRRRRRKSDFCYCRGAMFRRHSPHGLRMAERSGVELA